MSKALNEWVERFTSDAGEALAERVKDTLQGAAELAARLAGHTLEGENLQASLLALFWAWIQALPGQATRNLKEEQSKAFDDMVGAFRNRLWEALAEAHGVPAYVDAKGDGKAKRNPDHKGLSSSFRSANVTISRCKGILMDSGVSVDEIERAAGVGDYDTPEAGLLQALYKRGKGSGKSGGTKPKPVGEMSQDALAEAIAGRKDAADLIGKIMKGHDEIRLAVMRMDRDDLVQSLAERADVLELIEALSAAVEGAEAVATGTDG